MHDRPSIFITGAARGIGRACAEHFARAGWFVGLYDRDAKTLATCIAELGLGAAGHCEGVLDVRDADSVRVAIDGFARRTAGTMTVLLNNAGVMHVGRFEELSPAEHRQTLAVNLQGVIEVAHAGFELLRATPGARLINMSSLAAVHGVPEMASYSATKHAVRGLSEALAIEWATHGIRVCDVMPAFVDTELLRATRRLRSESVLGVGLRPEQVAEVVWAAATSSRRKTHWPVGWQARLAHALSGVAPAALQRWVLARMSGMHHD